MQICCVHNRGYSWVHKNSVYFKGYFYLDDDVGPVREDDAVFLLSRIKSFDEFVSFLAGIDGQYAVIIEKEDVVWAAVDVARSIPLYYSVDGSIVSDSSEHIRRVLSVQPEKVNSRRLLELYGSAFVANENTVYDEIKQVEEGTAVEKSTSKTRTEVYYNHFSETQDISFSQAKEQLGDLSMQMIKRTLKTVNGRPIVLSLSGGYDSRYLACLLKEHGVEDVLCYTYGRADSFESRQSQIVANALGYNWHCVTHTDDLITSILSEDTAPYIDYCMEHDNICYLQNYLAVRELHNRDLISPNSVFLTGLCNDMPTGSYVKPPEMLRNYSMSSKGLADYIVDRRFARYQVNAQTKCELVNEVRSRIENKGFVCASYQDFVRALDCITTCYDHSRRYLAMNKAHEFFGNEWLLPCWDKTLLDFWYSLPYEYRIAQKLYEEWSMTFLFEKHGLATKKNVAAHSSNATIAKIKRVLGGRLVKLLYPLGIPLKRSADINNFALLEPLLFKKIEQKESINPQRAGFLPLLTCFIMEQRYGKSFYSSLAGQLNNRAYENY